MTTLEYAPKSFVTAADHISEVLQTERLRTGRETVAIYGGAPRGAFFTAVFRAAGLDFDLDMQDQPRATSPSETDTFYLGLMTRKALEVDEIERGVDNISATTQTIEIFRELGLTDTPAPKTIMDIVRYCREIKTDYPKLDFSGTSSIGDTIEQTG